MTTAKNSPMPVTDQDPRLRVLNDQPVRTNGEFVLYWMQMYRRPNDNASLSYALQKANEYNLPCLVYEALRPDYPHASDRFHTFVLEGARDTAAELSRCGLRHVFFLPKTPNEARGIVAKLAARAALVVSDDFPSFTIPAQNAAAASRASCCFVAVDDNTSIPLALFPKAELAARTLRPKLNRVLDTWLRPLEQPEPAVAPPMGLDLPFEPVAFDRVDLAALVASCQIDHTVGPVADFPGGACAAATRLERFVARRLSGFDQDRKTLDGGSGLSPYLHFGMISARHIALTARSWGQEHGLSVDAFLEQLVVRRTLAFNFAQANPDHRTYEAIPQWARTTLSQHESDPRTSVLDLTALMDAHSPDPLWNTCQLDLRLRGMMPSYLRMLWGKLVLTWTKTPADAHGILVYLNDRFALDGRDPDGYANIAWCFGLHDRPFPQRAIYGTVRSMTSASTQRKFDLSDYLGMERRWRQELGL